MGKLKESDREPNVYPYRFFVDAFMELSNCRGTNNAIMFTAIVEYAKVFSVGDFEDFLAIIRKMDSRIMELDNARHTSKTDKS